MAARRTLLPVLGIVFVFLLIAARLYGELIPWGAPPAAFLFASVRGPVISSPDGERRLEVYFNDAGAAHSGNHWTWLVEKHWLLGEVVTLKGYLGPGVALDGDPVPLSWGPDGEFTVEFRGSRYDR